MEEKFVPNCEKMEVVEDILDIDVKTEEIESMDLDLVLGASPGPIAAAAATKRRRRIRKKRRGSTKAYQCSARTAALEFAVKRKSSRLFGMPPKVNYTFDSSDSDDEPAPKKERVAYTRAKPITKSVEQVTTEDIANIAIHSSKKVHSHNGSCCHQCRQKTLDTKTVCRSGICEGIRGQVCGPCLENRYGESAAAALMDPYWSCPVCRNICNCSFCRARQGKHATGVLTPRVHNMGFESVHDYLQENE